MGKESIEPLVTPEREEVVPNYLSASTGSCHDFCKYGRKEAFSAKKEKEKFVKAAKVRDDSLGMKYTPAVNSCPLSFKKPLVSKSYPPRRNASSVPDPPEVIMREISPPSENVDISVLEGSSKMADFQSEKQQPSVNSKLSKVKMFSSSETSGSVGGKGRTSDSKIFKKIMVSKVLTKKVSTPVVPLKSNRCKKLPMRTMKFGIPRGESKTTYNKNVSEKTLHVIKVGTEDGSRESTSSNNSIPSFSSPASPKSFSCTKCSPSSLHEKVHEETLINVVGMDEYVSSDKSHLTNVKKKRVKENNKTLTKSRVIVSEDKHRSPVKLMFRSGKVMDLQTDITSPRKLKFRKGRIVGAANGKANSRVKNFKKMGGTDGTADAKLPEKVVLKHQKVQGKRNAQGLFNNVIEATASKLVETRKSKVKALVGAFETVISLQEKKPVSHSTQ